MFNVFFLLPSFWFQATSILMRKKDVEQTKSATIFLDKNHRPLAPLSLPQMHWNITGRKRGWPRSYVREGGGLEMVNMKSCMMSWHDSNMKHERQACCIKTTGFSWKIGGVRGYLVCWCWIPCVLRWDFRCLCWKPPTKTGTRNSSPGGNGVFDTVYN